MRGTAIVVVLLLGLTSTAFAQGEIFSDDFETGLPFAWSSLSAWMPSIEIEPDFAGLTSQYVKPADGATITTVGSDGTEYRLTIPPNALIKPAVIIMIPIAAIPNLPLTDGLGAGVELLPDGLTFFRAVTLEITPASGTVPDTAVGFAFKENGSGFHLYPHLEESGTVTIPITGFSGYGYGFPTVLDLGPLSDIMGMMEASYQNAIAPPLARIKQADLLGLLPDPADLAAIKNALQDWHRNVVMTTADAVSLLAAQCGSNVAEVLARATNKRLEWEAAVELLAGFVDPISNFEAEDTAWTAKEASFCDQINTCDEACGAEENICDSFAKIPDLLEVQENLDVLGLACGVIGAPEICQGLNSYRLASVEMQCGDKIPVDGSTQIVAIPKSWFGTDVGKAHLSDPAGGSPIGWTVTDPSIASLVGATDELAVTVKGIEEGVTPVRVTLTQCERTVIGGCAVEVGDPLRVRIGACDWNSTSCHLSSLAGASTTVDVEALFDGAGPTDEIQIAVQPYRPLGDINIAPSASSCSQFPGDWGGFGCAGVAAPGERFTVGLTGLEPEFPVFAVHVTAQFEGAEQEAVAWAYSTDICYSEADWNLTDIYTFSAPISNGSIEYFDPSCSAPDSSDATIGTLSGSAFCGNWACVQSEALWWDTLLVIPNDLRLFEALFDTEGTLETPIAGAAFATIGGADGAWWGDGLAVVGGGSRSWSWELFEPFDPKRNSISFQVHLYSFGVLSYESWTDRCVNPHLFGRPFRLGGLGMTYCGAANNHGTAYAAAWSSASWDAVNAMTWEGDYLSLHDFRIFSCSGEFDLNWPP